MSERYVKCYQVFLHLALLLFQEVLAIIVFKAMGFVSDQQIVQMIGTEPLILSRLAYSLYECANLNIFSQNQALEYVPLPVRRCGALFVEM